MSCFWSQFQDCFWSQPHLIHFYIYNLDCFVRTRDIKYHNFLTLKSTVILFSVLGSNSNCLHLLPSPMHTLLRTLPKLIRTTVRTSHLKHRLGGEVGAIKTTTTTTITMETKGQHRHKVSQVPTVLRCINTLLCAQILLQKKWSGMEQKRPCSVS